MYSRKFDTGVVPPPNYGGISCRPLEGRPPEQDPECRPRRPLYEPRPQITPPIAEEPQNYVTRPDRPKRSHTGLQTLAGHSFTIEDIVLAGVILLLLTGDSKESDTDLIVLLGFLLLAGL